MALGSLPVWIIGVVTLAAWIIFVLVPALQLRTGWLPSESEWKRVRADIKSLNRELVDDTDYSANTQQAQAGS